MARSRCIDWKEIVSGYQAPERTSQQVVKRNSRKKDDIAQQSNRGSNVPSEFTPTATKIG
jgi:hypothetical protein